MVERLSEKLNLKQLQTVFQYSFQHSDSSSDLLNENEVLVSFGKDLQLVFICDAGMFYM